MESAPVVQAVRKILRLATVEIEVSDVLRVAEVRSFLFVDIPKSATLRLRGRVLGGFDLDSGFDLEARREAKALFLRLPKARILAIDPRIEWFDEKAGWLNPITPEDRTRWLTWARAALGKAAKDAGLAQKSEERAREVILETAQAFGWTAEVRFADAAPSPTPAANPRP